MPRVARVHHFVPQFLLAGFTPSGCKDDSFWASDQHTGRQWPTKPEKVAFRKDFYRINAVGVAPDAIETALSKMEGIAAPVIRDILRTAALPQDDDYTTLMYFVALMWCRVPSGRDLVNNAADAVNKQLLGAALRTRETWQAAIRTDRAAGHDIDEETASYEEMREFSREGKCTLQLDQDSQIKAMLEHTKSVAPCFAQRHWSLAISTSGSFICSDNPVVVRPTAMMSPGLMCNDTEITFPLSKNVLLVGSWEPIKSCAIRFSSHQVAFYNAIAARHSQRFLFSPARDFCWLDRGRIRCDFNPHLRA